MIRLGFMQGRLSPMVDGRIQAFPWQHWREEFPLAQQLGLHYMEWTLDHDRLFENPLLSAEGQAEINALQRACQVAVRTLTADFFMQAPFYKVSGRARQQRLDELEAVRAACSAVGIHTLVLPLVDNGSIESEQQQADLHEGLAPVLARARGAGQRIVFESDFGPERLAGFIAEWPAEVVGVNYDSGNSAALGYDPVREFAACADRIYNVHIKDRLLGGTTVPLGSGAADLPLVLRLLRSSGYDGLYILQTARAQDGDHAGALQRYRDYLDQCLSKASASTR